jgi:hypothetical protein
VVSAAAIDSKVVGTEIPNDAKVVNNQDWAKALVVGSLDY